MASAIATTARIGSAPSWASSLGGYYYAAGNSWYTVVQNTSDAGIQVMKAAYAGTSFAEQDAARNLTAIDSNSPFDWFPLGNFLYVVYFSTATGLRVRRFNMSTDLWELTDIGNATFATADQANPIRIAVRSDGDILVGYGPTTLAANLTRYEGAGWQTAVNMLSSAVITDIAMDGDDTAWLIMADTSAADLTVRSYSSTNVAGTVTDLDTAVDALNARTNQAVVYNDGTADRIGCGARDSTDEYDFWHFTTTGTVPGSPTVVNAVSDTDFDLQPTTIASAVVGTTLVTVWPKVNLIKYNISDDLATPVFSLTASQAGGTFTDTDCCPLIMTDGTSWGVVYQDSGTVSIEWIVAPAVGGSVEMAFAGDGVSTAAFAVAITKPIAMVADGVSTAAFALASTKPIAVAADGSSTATFALTTGAIITLDVAADGVSTAAYALAVVKPLAIAADVVSTVTFAMAVAKPAAIAADGISTATFGLAIAKPLAIAADGVSTASFDLTTAGGVTFDVSADGVSTTAFALAVSKPLAFTADGISTAAFDLATGGEVTLEVVAAGQSMAAFALALSKPLAVIVAGSSTAAFDARIARLLGLTVDAVSVATFAAAVDVRLALAASGQSTASFDLLIGEPIVGMRFGAPGRVTVLVSHERSELATAVRATRFAADPTIRSG